MARVLAFVQFLIVGIGAFTLHLLVRLNAEDKPDAIENLAQFLARHGLWLFAVPIVWVVFATATRDKLSEKTMNAIGIAWTAILFLVIAIPLTCYLM